MKYRVVFEFQSEDSAMSDVYNYRDEQQAQEKFLPNGKAQVAPVGIEFSEDAEQHTV